MDFEKQTLVRGLSPSRKQPTTPKCLNTQLLRAVCCLGLLKVPQVSEYEIDMNALYRFVQHSYGVSSQLYVFYVFFCFSIYTNDSLFGPCFLQVAPLKMCVDKPRGAFYFYAGNTCFIQCQQLCCVSRVNAFDIHV